MSRVIMLLMPHLLKVLAVTLLVAVMPLRALAGVTIGFCASGHNDMAAAAHGVAQGHDARAHAHDARDLPAQPQQPSCNICAEHCSSAAFAPATGVSLEARPMAQDRTVLAERGAPHYIPEQLDRPPLA